MKPIILKGKESSIEQLMALSFKALNLSKNTVLKNDLTTYEVATRINAWLLELAATRDMPSGHIELLKDAVYAFNELTNFTVDSNLKSYDIASAIDGVLRDYNQANEAKPTESEKDKNNENERVSRHSPALKPS